MDYNTIIVLVGIVFIIIAIYAIIKSNNSANEYNRNDYNITSLKDIERAQVADAVIDKELTTRVDIAEGDIIKLRQDLKQLMTIYTQAKEAAVAAVKVNETESGGFNQSLNYSMFLQRNNDIIQLYNEDTKIEDIAKKLNKSIREIEMVIKLIK